MAVVGADADALDRLAGELESEATALEAMHRALGRQLHSAPWRGASADRFRQNWSGNHAGHVARAAEFLRANSLILRDNARQQRAASDGVGGVTPGPGLMTAVGPARDSEGLPGWWDGTKETLETLGIPVEQMQLVLDLLEKLDPELRESLVDLLGGSGFTDFLDLAGDALGIAGMVVDFVDAFASHSDLPLDEALVFSFATVGLGFAADKGIEFVSEKVGAALGTAIFPGGGTAAGIIIAKVAGAGLKAGYKALDDQFGVTENAAEAVLDVYRGAKDLAEATYGAVETVADVAENVVDGAVDLAGNVVDGAADIAGNVVDGAAGIASGAKDLVGKAWPF